MTTPVAMVGLLAICTLAYSVTGFVVPIVGPWWNGPVDVIYSFSQRLGLGFGQSTPNSCTGLGIAATWSSFWLRVWPGLGQQQQCWFCRWVPLVIWAEDHRLRTCILSDVGYEYHPSLSTSAFITAAASVDAGKIFKSPFRSLFQLYNPTNDGMFASWVIFSLSTMKCSGLSGFGNFRVPVGADGSSCDNEANLLLVTRLKSQSILRNLLATPLTL